MTEYNPAPSPSGHPLLSAPDLKRYSPESAGLYMPSRRALRRRGGISESAAAKMLWAGAGPRGIGANAGPRHLSCCSWLLLLSLSALLLLRGSLLLPVSSLLPGPSLLRGPVLQADARGVNASLIRGVNPLDENRTTSAALGSGRAAGMPPHAIEFARSG